MTDATEKARKLWEKYAQDKSQDTKNELVLHYMYLVKRIVYRLLPTYEGYSNFDDLLSCGVLGLIDAINKFDIRREIQFENYACMRIRGEIIDHMRKQDWAPSSLRRKIQAISGAYAELEKQLSREPSDSEVADYVGMNEKEMKKIVNKMHMFNVMHFEEMISGDCSLAQVVQDKGETPEEKVENNEMKKLLVELIDTLPEKERLVVTLYYYEELTLKEIAGILGVSESRASQIHSKIIMKFRSRMDVMFN